MNTESAIHQYSILIIDDHPLFRRGIGQLLSMRQDLKVIGEAADGQQGLELAEQLHPDLVLLDLNMKGRNGIETLKALKTINDPPLVAMFTVSDDEDAILASLSAGADGYLLKDTEPEELLAKLSVIIQGDIGLSLSLRKYLVRALNQQSLRPAHLERAQLTEREIEVLQQLMAGQSNKEIGRKLRVTEGTIKVHLKNMYRKLNLNSRLEATVWARENLYGR